MIFEEGQLYHVFNRGNNSQKIFFNRENYLFFFNKIRKYILPHADIVAWCLMPNHFHLMIYINCIDAEISEQITPNQMLTKKRTLNDSISIMLRSYTRAIQIQENMTGSLFQNRTKATCLTQIEGLSPNWFQSSFGTIVNISNPQKDYPQVCFDYIHCNPVKDKLVNRSEDWEFSSAPDYAGLRNGQMINKERASEFGLIYTRR
jgi:putative transposase